MEKSGEYYNFKFSINLDNYFLYEKYKKYNLIAKSHNLLVLKESTSFILSILICIYLDTFC